MANVLDDIRQNRNDLEVSILRDRYRRTVELTIGSSTYVFDSLDAINIGHVLAEEGERAL